MDHHWQDFLVFFSSVELNAGSFAGLFALAVELFSISRKQKSIECFLF
jgi:hypothetical protein